MPVEPQDLLRAALTESVASAPHRRVLLSQLGVALRLRIPGFTPKMYGFESLRGCVEAFPDIGRLEQGEKPQEWWFTAASRDIGAPGAGAPGDGAAMGSTAQAPPVRSIRGGRRLRQSWWDAWAGGDDAVTRAWLDLEAHTLVEDESQVAREPERYLAIPRFDLKSFARRWLAEFSHLRQRPPPEELDALFEGGDWRRGFETWLAGHAAEKSFKRARNQAILDRALSWARAHGIQEDRMLEQPREWPPSRERRARAPHGESLRATLHRLIDCMSDTELTHLSWPVHILVRHLPQDSEA